jgi:hypothetical protein
LIVVGEFVEVDPNRVWRVIEQYGVSSDDDMRGGVGCTLLERLLEHHFKKHFPAVRWLALSHPLFADTVDR